MFPLVTTLSSLDSAAGGSADASPDFDSMKMVYGGSCFVILYVTMVFYTALSVQGVNLLPNRKAAFLNETDRETFR